MIISPFLKYSLPGAIMHGGCENNYLVAFSRTERVRKLIHMPFLCPRIHSRIPDWRTVMREKGTDYILQRTF